MKTNLSITLDTDTITAIRMTASKQGVSVSRLVSDIIIKQLGLNPTASLPIRLARVMAVCNQVCPADIWTVAKTMHKPGEIVSSAMLELRERGLLKIGASGMWEVVDSQPASDA
jgi:hypothetical protein